MSERGVLRDATEIFDRQDYTTWVIVLLVRIVALLLDWDP